jgi:hypothetical protein
VGDSGGTTEATLACPRDGTATRLRCAECQGPICPACYVRTPVGLRCPECAASSLPPLREAEPRPRWLVPAAVAAVVALVVAAALFTGGGSEEPAIDLGAPASRQSVRVGTGDLPVGRWVLDARRDNRVCATLSIEPGAPGREHCRPLPGGRAVAFTSTQTVRVPARTVYLTWGLVSEQTARVRVAPEGAPAWDVPAMGGDLNLGGRFFVAYTETNITTFTALAADGSELGRIRSAPPGS